MSTSENDPIFTEEQAHLRVVYAQLEQLRTHLENKIAAIDAQAAADKNMMTEDIRVNTSSFDEALETYAAFAAVNRVIDTYNLSSETASRKLADVELLLRQPYFAKVVLDYDNEEETRELYIGAAGASDENFNRLIVDWRSPVAEVYYNQQMGRTSYRANGRTFAALRVGI